MTVESKNAWRSVRKGHPCTICGKEDWCSISEDRHHAICRRIRGGREKVDSAGAHYWVYTLKRNLRSAVTRGDRGRQEIPATDSEARHPLAPADVRNRVYSTLLSDLGLSNADTDALLNRGLNSTQIDKGGYATLPGPGRSAYVRRLFNTYGDVCLQVPGIVRRTPTDSAPYTSLAGRPGLLTPVRNLLGQIVALKIRPTIPRQGCKYIYLSSRSQGGPGPGAPAHVPILKTPTELIRVTEGELKADVATALSDVFTISVPGVGAWRTALPILRALRPREVRLAFDADCVRNPAVARAIQSAAAAFVKEGF